ncbi:hypothetical protein AAZX31_19G062600 [Glycine max]|uniref:uncharacterized protein LOC114399647 isoform X2 n=1 Tax=Glycine soja TaxID=3848 RepID=UPI00103CB166|nr:uncharacterized protein LOC114399647 isoform X2 [Glycine soja]
MLGPATPDKFEIPIRSESMKNDQYSSPLLKINGSNRERCSMDEERSVRIMDSGVRKPAGSGMKIIDSGCSHGDSFHYKATIEFGILSSRTHIDDEYAYAVEKDPKILLTWDPSAPLQQFVKELSFVFPNVQRMNRGGQNSTWLIQRGVKIENN